MTRLRPGHRIRETFWSRKVKVKNGLNKIKYAGEQLFPGDYSLTIYLGKGITKTIRADFKVVK